MSYNQQPEVTASNLRLMDELSQKELLFNCIRSANLSTIRTILQVNRNILNSKLFGYEGSDVYEEIKESKSKRCYHYTGSERDGYFYPLQVAAECGHKQLVLLMVKAGADLNLLDYRGDCAEDKANGEGMHAFYELRGLKFEACDRYAGPVDRNGQRSGQGELYFKMEGYLSKEYLSYRGGFKLGVFNGHGNLYWPSSDHVQYVGRFKNGLKHGRGIEFDALGVKIYQGAFREDKRDGRGEEYEGGQVVYIGEYSAGCRHGFGIAYIGEGHRFIGRFENNAMAGVGIYSQPNGDRFEGMFYSNKPDGPGSLYKNSGGELIETHAIWQMNRVLKSLTTPFAPKSVDMPSDNDDLAKSFASVVELSSVEKGLQSVIDPKSSSGSEPKDNWKLALAKYVRVPQKDYDALGLPVPIKSTSQGLAEDEDEEDNSESIENDLDEVLGFHFMNSSKLYIAYVYVCSAAKVFEGRLAMTSLPEAAPDFEAVYHLVIDAVDYYNESWERECQKQETLKAEELQSAVSIASHGGGNVSGNNATPGAKVVATRLMFMNEKEKKEEQVVKQRAELAAKKGTAELNSIVERKIEAEAVSVLQLELQKLLSEAPVENNTAAPTSLMSRIATRKGLGWDLQQGWSTQAPVSNEFAAELLNLLETAGSFL